MATKKTTKTKAEVLAEEEQAALEQLREQGLAVLVEGYDAELQQHWVEVGDPLGEKTDRYSGRGDTRLNALKSIQIQA